MLKHIHKDQLFSRADYWGNGYIIKVKQREQKQQPQQQQQHSCILKLFLTPRLLLPISAKFARKCKSAVSLLAGAVFMMRQLHDRPTQCQVLDQLVTELQLDFQAPAQAAGGSTSLYFLVLGQFSQVCIILAFQTFQVFFELSEISELFKLFELFSFQFFKPLFC